MQRTWMVVVKGLVIFGLVGAWGQVIFTQSAARGRILGPIAGSPAVWLAGNRRRMFQQENDLGPAADSFELQNIAIHFKLTPDQQANLTSLLAEQQDSASPNYHHWLTPEQFADRFGLSAADLAQVAAWLRSQGFTITGTARSRLWITFAGTAAQVRSALQTEIHHYSLKGKTYYANASEPAVPAVLSDVVMGFTGLDNYQPRPHGIFRRIAAGRHPNFTSNISGDTFVTPADFATIYDVQNLYNTEIDGSGESIAVVGQTDIQLSDIAAFRSASQLPASTPTVVVTGSDPGTSTDAAVIDEAALDIEWSGAVARGAKIFYVNSNNAVLSSLQYAVDQKLAPVLSTSFGDCEADWGATNLANIAQFTQEANTQGQTIVAASGDSGAADCDASSNPNSTITTATHGYAVDAPASLPYVTGLGGSEFNEGAGIYWQATTSSSGDILNSALSYIPETAWNDTSSAENTSHQLLAGGGGKSSVYPKPLWQTGPGVPNDGARDVPDVSLNASAVHDVYLICVQGSCVNGYRDATGTLTVAGGTSAAAPSFAGILALLDQKTGGSGLQNINPILYALAQSSPAAFHDITAGNNDVPCTPGSTDCPSGGEIGYSAGPGYDLASGLGSLDVYNLVMEWGPVTSNLPAPALSTPLNGSTGQTPSPTLIWSPVTGNSGYSILLAPSPSLLTSNPTVNTCAAPCIVATTNQSTYKPAALTAGTYYWEVQAIPSTSGAYGAWSNMFSFTVGSSTLAAPTLSSPANSATGINLPAVFSWSSVAGNAGYRVAVASSLNALPASPVVGYCGGGCSIDAATAANTFTSNGAYATSLNGGTTYYWQAQALAPTGGESGPWSAVASFTTAPADFTPNASPNSLSIAPGSSGTSIITLAPINNFSATPSFTCNLPNSLANVTCSAGPYNTSNDSAVVTITAASNATLLPFLPRDPGSSPWRLLSLAMVCVLLIVSSRLSRATSRAALRILRIAMVSGILALLLVCAGSCGGGSTGVGGNGSTSGQPESGSATVTVTSGSTSHNVTIAVSVT